MFFCRLAKNKISYITSVPYRQLSGIFHTNMVAPPFISDFKRLNRITFIITMRYHYGTFYLYTTFFSPAIKIILIFKCKIHEFFYRITAIK